MKDNSNSKEQKPNLFINLNSKVRNDLMNSKININYLLSMKTIY